MSLLDELRALVERRTVLVTELREIDTALDEARVLLGGGAPAIVRAPTNGISTPVAPPRWEAEIDRRTRIIAVLARGPLPTRELARFLDVDRSVAKQILQRMAKIGLLTRTGEGNSTRWALPTNGTNGTANGTAPVAAVDVRTEPSMSTQSQTQKCIDCQKRMPVDRRRKRCPDCQLRFKRDMVRDRLRDKREEDRKLQRRIGSAPVQPKDGRTGLDLLDAISVAKDMAVHNGHELILPVTYTGERWQTSCRRCSADAIVTNADEKAVASAPHKTAPKVDASIVERRDAEVLRIIANNNGVATIQELQRWFPKKDPAAADPAARDEALKNALLRLKTRGAIARTADTWSLVGAGMAARG